MLSLLLAGWYCSSDFPPLFCACLCDFIVSLRPFYVLSFLLPQCVMLLMTIMTVLVLSWNTVSGTIFTGHISPNSEIIRNWKELHWLSFIAKNHEFKSFRNKFAPIKSTLHPFFTIFCCRYFFGHVLCRQITQAGQLCFQWHQCSHLDLLTTLRAALSGIEMLLRLQWFSGRKHQIRRNIHFDNA